MESVRRLGFEVQGAVDGADAVERVSRYKPWLVVTDLKMPRLGGLDLIKEIKSRSPHTLMVLMTAYGTVETAVEAMKYGASDYILKPFSTELIERVIANLKARGADAALSPAAPIDQRSILTQDPGMARLLSTVEGVAASQATVLIHGESGTGKELLARFIHSRSPRAHRPQPERPDDTRLSPELRGRRRPSGGLPAARRRALHPPRGAGPRRC